MKLWIVSVGEPLPVDGSNIRLRRMGNLAMYASSHGVDVEWFSVSFEHYQKKQRCLSDKVFEINKNFKINLVYVNGYKKNISVARIIHHIQAARKIKNMMESMNKPDAIIASMEPLEVSKATVKYGIENNVPVVVDVRDLWPEIYYDVIPKKLHWLLDLYVFSCKKSLEYTTRNCKSIIGLSEGFLQYGLKYAGRKRLEKDKVIPIAYPNYNYDEYKNRLEEFWGKYNISKDDFLVVFLGNFGNQFVFEPIIEAANVLSSQTNIKFVLCGLGVQQEFVKENVSDNVILPGWIEKEQILSLLANAGVGIAPYIDSKNYTMNTPNKFGEYLSASLPIAVSVTGEMMTLLQDRECGHRYSSGEDLVEIINKYYKDREYRKEHAYNARKLYDEKFNADTVNEKLLNHILSVVEGKK